MPTLASLLRVSAAAKKEQLVVLKDFNAKEVAEAVETYSKETALPVQRVDLSNVVSKYISETEKNLQRILEKAGSSEAILFFDEADALFGKRTDVKDAHDRYANRKTAYLFQKLEAYNGPVIVALNKKNSADKPFLRRWRASDPKQLKQ